jgi:hypothetical protein
MAAALMEADYFLSAENAAMTADQQQVERWALEIRELPEVRAATERSTHYWRAAMQPDWDATAQVMFGAAMEEYAFNYILKAAVSDADHPRIAQVFLPAHDCFGHSVPGSRIGGDNPDNIYRFIGIEHGVGYRLHGIVSADSPANVSYTLVANYGCTETVATIENHDITVCSDGHFIISIDENPSSGRPNHLQTKPGTCFLFIRDTLTDWAAERANRLRIERLTPPRRDPLTIEEMGARAARAMFENVTLYYWYQRTCQFPVNGLTPAFRSGSVGGLITQAGSFGGFRLGEDDCVIVRIDPGGARYHSIVAHDMYYRTVEAGERPSSYNAGQTIYGPDGVATYVFSHRDPGVANWVDTAGLPATIILQRWQALPPGDLAASSATQHIKLTDLNRLLGTETGSVTSAERARQIEARRQSYQRRLIGA